MLGPHARRTQVPKPAFIKLIGNQAQNAFTVMLRGQRTVAVALAQSLEVMNEVAHGRAPFIDTGLAGLCQRDRRIGANGQALLFAANAVLPAPMLAPSRQDFQVEAAAVGIAFAGFAFRATRILTSGVGQGHLGDFWLAQLGNCG